MSRTDEIWVRGVKKAWLIVGRRIRCAGLLPMLIVGARILRARMPVRCNKAKGRGVRCVIGVANQLAGGFDDWEGLAIHVRGFARAAVGFAYRVPSLPAGEVVRVQLLSAGGVFV